MSAESSAVITDVTDVADIVFLLSKSQGILGVKIREAVYRVVRHNVLELNWFQTSAL